MDKSKVEKRREYDREWKRQDRLKNPEKVRAYGRLKYQRIKEDPDKLEKHKDYMRSYRKEWEKDNPKRLEYRRQWMKEWNRKNAKEIYKRRRARPYEKIASSMRTRIRECIQKGYKSDKTEKLLGMTVRELKAYLELKFKVGMSWDNYGDWHIDHIIPLSSFDLKEESEQKKAFHYSNLQPLWAKENMSKGARLSN